jgi:uncharacterized protein (TIGR02996 family)
MTTEDDFQAALDAATDDWQTRLVFADWLQDRSDPRSDGYRVLGSLRLRPTFDRTSNPWSKPSRPLRGCWSWWIGTRAVDLTASVLVRDWFEAIETADHYKPSTGVVNEESKDWYKRRQAEDAAALAFLRLPAERRAELLAVPTT